jgi:hypothetical protein
MTWGKPGAPVPLQTFPKYSLTDVPGCQRYRMPIKNPAARTQFGLMLRVWLIKTGQAAIATMLVGFVARKSMHVTTPPKTT